MGLYLQSPSPDNHSVSSEDISCLTPFLLPSPLNTLRKHSGWTDSLQVSSYLTLQSLCIVARSCDNLSHALGAKHLRKVPGFFVNSFHPHLVFCHEWVKPRILCESQWWMNKDLGIEAPVNCISLVIETSGKSYHHWNKAVRSQLLNMQHGLLWELAPE